MSANYKGIIISMDIGKYQYVVVALILGGQFSKPFKIENNRTGYEALLERTIQRKKKHQTDQVIVRLDSTDHDWEVPAQWFTSQSISVVQVNALHTKRGKEIEDRSTGKTDDKDAPIIAQFVYYGKIHSMCCRKGALANIRELARIHQQHLVTEHTEKRNYLHRLLDSVFPVTCFSCY